MTEETVTPWRSLAERSLEDLAIAAIRERASMRTPAIAEQLGIDASVVDPLLGPARVSGMLITSAVQLAGGLEVIEYRYSGYTKGVAIHPLRSYPRRDARGLYAPHPITAQQPAPQQPAPPQPVKPPPSLTQEEPHVTLVERAQAFFAKHGPMNAREVRRHDPDLADHLKELVNGAVLGRLGGKTSSMIYGLPHQNASDAKPEEPGAKPKKSGKKPATNDKPPRRIHAKKKRAAKARKASRKANGAFRPALCADGAILFIGAKGGEFEVDRNDARVLLAMLRHLTTDEIVATVEFLGRLDGAAVKA